MKAVLISIQPKWCELIANGKKTIEVRKTRPKLKTPFKCYIYCTIGKRRVSNGHYTQSILNPLWRLNSGRVDIGKNIDYEKGDLYEAQQVNGKVIGEFVCDAIIPLTITYSNPDSEVALNELQCICLTDKQIMDYLGNGKQGYGWHISDLVIYDKPKELEEFTTFCKGTGTASDKLCVNCRHLLFDNDPISGYTRWCDVHHRKPLTRAPQSFCYVDSLDKKGDAI